MTDFEKPAASPAPALPESGVDAWFGNCDAWGAAQWFERLAKAVNKHGDAVRAGDKLSSDTYRNIAMSSAFRLASDYAVQVRAALATPAPAPAPAPALLRAQIEDYKLDALPGSEYRRACDDILELLDKPAPAPVDAGGVNSPHNACCYRAMCHATGVENADLRDALAAAAEREAALVRERAEAVQEREDAELGLIALMWLPGVRAALDKLPPGDKLAAHMERLDQLLAAEARVTAAEAERERMVGALDINEDELALALTVARSQKPLPSDFDWPGEMDRVREFERKHPSYITGFSMGTDALRMARAALDLIRARAAIRKETT